MTDQERQLDDLFQCWASRCSDVEQVRFVKDGIINQADWKQCGKRVVFLLKEPNLGESGAGNHDFREWARKEPWAELGYWAYALQKTTPSSIPPFDQAKQAFRSACAASAVVNLKKIGGGGIADDNALAQALNRDWDLIAKQLAIIQPTIVVCGGTWALAATKVPLDPNRSWSTVGDVLWIKYCHPSARVDSEIKYYGLAALYQQVLQQQATGAGRRKRFAWLTNRCSGRALRARN